MLEAVNFWWKSGRMTDGNTQNQVTAISASDINVPLFSVIALSAAIIAGTVFYFSDKSSVASDIRVLQREQRITSKEVSYLRDLTSSLDVMKRDIDSMNRQYTTLNSTVSRLEKTNEKALDILVKLSDKLDSHNK